MLTESWTIELCGTILALNARKKWCQVVMVMDYITVRNARKIMTNVSRNTISQCAFVTFRIAFTFRSWVSIRLKISLVWQLKNWNNLVSSQWTTINQVWNQCSIPKLLSSSKNVDTNLWPSSSNANLTTTSPVKALKTNSDSPSQKCSQQIFLITTPISFLFSTSTQRCLDYKYYKIKSWNAIRAIRIICHLRL